MDSAVISAAPGRGQLYLCVAHSLLIALQQDIFTTLEQTSCHTGKEGKQPGQVLSVGISKIPVRN